MAALIWLRLIAAVAVGFVAWRGEFWAMPISLVAPCLIALQPSRIAAGCTAVAYYGAASIPVIAVSKLYWPSSGALVVVLWLAASAILSLPWWICWTAKHGLRPWATVGALPLSAIPPLCIVGWASPLASAGVLFPGTAWFGLAAAAALPGLLLHMRTRAAALFASVIASIILNAQMRPVNTPKGWEAHMTAIHRERNGDGLADFLIEGQLQRTVTESYARFLVFPEAAVRRWTEATGAFWSPVLDDTEKTVLIGAGQPIPGSSRYYNSVVVWGKEAREAVHQRIPVPGGMWNPLRPKGTVAPDLFGSGTVDVGGQRVAILICYEQLLTWPMIRSALENPTLLIAISNEAWTSTTVVPRVQRASALAWARLFGLPLISAINS